MQAYSLFMIRRTERVKTKHNPSAVNPPRFQILRIDREGMIDDVMTS